MLIMSEKPRSKDKISSQFFYNKIKYEHFQDIDLSDEKTIKQFTQFIQSLPLELDNLVIIKLLAESYGLPVVIYFKKFYQKAQETQQFISQEIKWFNKISSIVKWATNKQQIQSINFIHAIASSQKEYKGIQMEQIDFKFIQFIKKLDQKTKQIANEVKRGLQREQIQKCYSQYKEWIDLQLKSNNFDLIMKQSTKKFMINMQQINRLCSSDSQNRQSGTKSTQNNKQTIQTTEFQIGDGQKEGQVGSSCKISFSEEDANSFLNDSKDYYKLPKENQNIKHLFQSSISQKQKNVKIQLQNNSYASFLEGMSSNTNGFSKKTSKGQKSPNLNSSQKQKQIEYKYCQITPNPKKQPFLPQKSIKSDCRAKDTQTRNICCRTYFYYEQKINQMQEESIQYMNAPFPFKKQKNQQIKKVICSFLNHSGGILYIGIVRQNFEYVVVGNVICEGEKQAILKSFRQICQTILPDILTHKMYNIEFVPLKQKYTKLKGQDQQQKERYIAGNYVLKVIVRYGIRDQIYSYKSGYTNAECFPFRCQKQIIHKQGRQLLKQLQHRIKYPLSIPIPLHSHPCLKPEIGEVLNNTYIDFEYTNKKSRVSQQTHFNYLQKQGKVKQKQSYESHHKNKSPIKENKKNATSPKKSIVHFDIEKTPESMNKKTLKKYGQLSSKASPVIELRNQKQQITEKNKIKQLRQSCIFVKGLTLKQFSSVLQKKGMIEKVKMEQSLYDQTEGFVIKTFDSESKQKIYRMLQKIGQKYQKKLSISYDEITLQMQVVNLQQAISGLKQKKIEYKVISQGVIKFTYYKDSLKAFIYLKKRNFHLRYV